MVRPGTNVISRANPPSRGAATDTGTWFVSGLADRGTTSEAKLVQNMTEFIKAFGPRVSYSLLYDSLDVFFREGGVEAYVVRVVGPAAVKDKVTLNDSGAAASIRVDSIGEGSTEYTVQVVAGTVAGTFVLVIADATIEVERSYNLVDVAEAVTWGTSSRYVRVVALGANDPAVIAAQALTTGVDDRAAITDTHRVASLAKFTKALGPGQISFPGATTAVVHAALLNHAKSNFRVAILDGTDTISDTTLNAQADANRVEATLADEAEQRGGLFAPWLLTPGVVKNTTRTVPPSALVAALMARSDGITLNPNIAAAGANGMGRYTIGLSQSPWTDTQREAMNERGVNVLRMYLGSVQLYGYRTLAATDDPWLSLASARLRMVIETQADAIGEKFMFAQLDGKRRKIAEFGGALTGMVQGYWTVGALFGDTADEAFIVDVGPAINTPETIANRELRAVIGLRTSEFAEMITIEIVKVPITESL